MTLGARILIVYNRSPSLLSKDLSEEISSTSSIVQMPPLSCDRSLPNRTPIKYSIPIIKRPPSRSVYEVDRSLYGVDARCLSSTPYQSDLMPLFDRTIDNYLHPSPLTPGQRTAEFFASTTHAPRSRDASHARMIDYKSSILTSHTLLKRRRPLSKWCSFAWQDASPVIQPPDAIRWG